MNCFNWEDFLNLLESVKGKGQLVEIEDVKIFFGNHHFSKADLQNVEHSWFELKQVHGNVLIPAATQVREADGHYTSQAHHGLLIRTADCMPVFVVNGKQIIALHIGWRGLAKRIFSGIKKIHLPKQPTIAYVGPHLRQANFALDRANAQYLLGEHGISWKTAFAKNIAIPSLHQKDHFLISMEKILKREAANIGITDILFSRTNTFTSPTHYSHRRNRHHKTRNLSFIIQ